jgi:type I restriction enzyme, S subunit
MKGEYVRLRFIAPLRGKTSPGTDLSGDVAFLPMEAIGEDGTYDQGSVRPVAEVAGAGYTYFEQGDVVRARVTPCFENAKGALVSTVAGGRGFGTTELFVFKPSERIDPRFLYYVTVSDDFTNKGTATMYGAHGVRRVDDQFARDYRVWLPSLSSQRAIVDHLDRETMRIDALVAAKKRMIALQAERLESAAAAFVDGSRSQGRTAPLWTVLRPHEVTGEPGLEVLSVYRDHGVIPKASRSDNFNKTPPDLSRYQVVSPGDVVVNKMKAWQGSIGVSEFQGIVSPDYLVCRPLIPMDRAYLHHVLRSPRLRAEFHARSEGIRPAQWRLQWDQMRLIEIPLPEADVQVRAASAQAKENARAQKVSSALRKQVELLQEHRRALITAAVTGRLDIPGAA